MNPVAVGLSLCVSLLLTWLTTPNIEDYSIPWDIKAWVLRFGLTFVLVLVAVGMLARLRKPRGDEPPRLS